MQGKLALVVGLAAGYVLGSRAGRQRYEEIVSTARKVGSNPTVQSTAGVLQAQASDLVSKAKQTVRGQRDSDDSDGYDMEGTGTRPTTTVTADSGPRTSANGISP